MRNYKAKLPDSYEEALNRIKDDYYNNQNISQILMAWIEDYLIRENGRLGRINKGIYNPFK